MITYFVNDLTKQLFFSTSHMQPTEPVWVPITRYSAATEEDIKKEYADYEVIDNPKKSYQIKK